MKLELPRSVLSARSLREQERDLETERPVGAEAGLLDVVVGLEAHLLTGWGPILNTRPAPPPSGTSQVLSELASQLAVMIGAETRNQPSGRL